jgi:hypothetical protein
MDLNLRVQVSEIYVTIAVFGFLEHVFHGLHKTFCFPVGLGISWTIVRFKKDIGLSNWEPAVVETDHGERSFILRSGNDKLYRRNRQTNVK